MLKFILKISLIMSFFIFVPFLYGESNIDNTEMENLLRNSFSFQLKENVNYNNKFYSQYRGTINYQNGNWSSLFAGSYEWIEVKNVEIKNTSIILTIQYTRFSEKGKTQKYWNWNYPFCYNIEISKEIIYEILDCKRNNSIYYFYLNEIEYTNGTCQAIVITDNLRVRSLPNTNSDVVYKLNKFQNIKLIDCTNEKEKIDGINASWYKVKLDNDVEGWIFGGYAKIYFSIKNDKEKIIETFKEEGSEYIY